MASAASAPMLGGGRIHGRQDRSPFHLHANSRRPRLLKDMVQDEVEEYAGFSIKTDDAIGKDHAAKLIDTAPKGRRART